MLRANMAILMILMAVPVWGGDSFSIDLGGYSEMIGVYAADRQTLKEYVLLEYLTQRKWLTPDAPMLKIILEAEDTGDKKIMQIKTEADLPYESVPVDCPKGFKYHFKKCFFIKYKHESY